MFTQFLGDFLFLRKMLSKPEVVFILNSFKLVPLNTIDIEIRFEYKQTFLSG